tara:strand:+ start:118 stop:825 length:708 start_codon:yes stop_codon:yes gene_type:complete
MIDIKNKIIVKNYNINEYNFNKYFLNLLKTYTNELDKLHKFLPKDLIPNKVVNFKTDQSLSIYKILYQIDEGYDLKVKKKNSGFLNVFEAFVDHISKTIFKEDLIYQSRPTLRVNFPGNKAVGAWHRDREYNHPLEEINIWVPITKSINTNAIWIESEFDKNDFTPINLDYGQFIMFDSGLKHGNKLNTEDKTRISLDFRVIPKSLYKVSNKTSVKTDIKFKIGEYYKSTKIFNC